LKGLIYKYLHRSKLPPKLKMFRHRAYSIAYIPFGTKYYLKIMENRDIVNVKMFINNTAFNLESFEVGSV
jgi:hypothetical protein